MCRCPVGTAGDPHEQCYSCKKSLCCLGKPANLTLNFCLDECLTDRDCPLTKACQNQKCIDPCLEVSCGALAVCSVEYHRARCTCPPGLQGNPLVRCVPVGCLENADCNQDERCDYPTQKCEPLCVTSPCAVNARCEASNHRERCICERPYEGDGYALCALRKSTAWLNFFILFASIGHISF